MAKKRAHLDNGEVVTKTFYEKLIKEELVKIKEYVGKNATIQVNLNWQPNYSLL